MSNAEEIKALFIRLQEMGQGSEDLRWGAIEIEQMTNGALSVELIRGLAEQKVIEPTYEKSVTNREFGHFTPTQIRKAAVAERMMLQEPVVKWNKFKQKLNVEMIKENGLGVKFFEEEWGQAIVLAMAGRRRLSSVLPSVFASGVFSGE